MNTANKINKPNWLLRLQFLEELIRPYKEETARKLRHGKDATGEILCIVENLLSLGDGFYDHLTGQDILYYVDSENTIYNDRIPEDEEDDGEMVMRGAGEWEDDDEENIEMDAEEIEREHKIRIGKKEGMVVEMLIISAKKQLPRVLNLLLTSFPAIGANIVSYMFTGLGMCSHINRNFLQTVRVAEKHHPNFGEWKDFVVRCAYFGSTKNIRLLFTYYPIHFDVRTIVFILRRHSHSPEHIRFLKQVYARKKPYLTGPSDKLNIYEAAQKHACLDLYTFFSHAFGIKLILPRVVAIDETWSLCSRCVTQNKK